MGWLLALIVAYVLVSLLAFGIVEVDSRRPGGFGLSYRTRDLLSKVGYPWVALEGWIEDKRFEASLPKCRVCGYRPPRALAGATFLGKGGLNKCTKCLKVYCNDHAKRVPMGSFNLLNCPDCGEQLERV